MADPDDDEIYRAQAALSDAKSQVRWLEYRLKELGAEPWEEPTIRDIRVDIEDPEGLKFLNRVAKLEAHIEHAKKNGSGFKSVPAFCKSLNRGAGIDKAEFYKWARGGKWALAPKDRLNAPGYALLIEEAIDKL